MGVQSTTKFSHLEPAISELHEAGAHQDHGHFSNRTRRDQIFARALRDFIQRILQFFRGQAARRFDQCVNDMPRRERLLKVF